MNNKSDSAQSPRCPNYILGFTRDVHGNMQINKKEAELIRSVYRMYVSEKMGLGKIALALNTAGYLTKHGKSFQQVTVERILTNRYYIDRLIPVEMFEKAQAILIGKKNITTPFRPHPGCYSFSGILYCKNCGSVFRRLSRTYKHTYITWVCMNRNMKGKSVCENGTSISEEELADVLRGYFQSIIEKKNAVRSAILKAYISDSHRRQADIDRAALMVEQSFDQMETLCGEKEFNPDRLKSVIKSIEVGSDGSIDILLTLFDKLGINGDVLAG